jgi:glycerol-3-phosphate dehydrogenase (NAD(P)+)
MRVWSDAMNEQIAIIGAGSWGTALAKLLAEKGNDVLIWAFEKAVVEGINEKHANPLYLPEVKLPKNVKATEDVALALQGKRSVLSVVPSKALRIIWTKYGGLLDPESLLLSCTKGIEEESLKLMSDVLSECLPKHPRENRVVLSGPSFAREVAEGLPTSVVIAGARAAVVETFQRLVHSNSFLAFTNDDIVGVEVGGAVKNVIAIATGISDGLGLGHNTRAAIITRGLYEMIKIGNAMGANPLTFAGLSGIGDLVLTCTAELSRNHTLGFHIGKGDSLEGITSKMRMVAEGVPTTRAVHQLAEKKSIKAPICEAMYRILFEGLPPRQAVTELCSMEIRNELGAILKNQL